MNNEFEINSDRFAQVRSARNTETAEDYTEMIADLIKEKCINFLKFLS